MENRFNIQWERDEGNTVSSAEIGHIQGVKCFKVVNYGGKWFAYFRPMGWKNFGNSVSKYAGASNHFQDKNEAKRACIRHADTFGPLPSSHRWLIENPVAV